MIFYSFSLIAGFQILGKARVLAAAACHMLLACVEDLASLHNLLLANFGGGPTVEGLFQCTKCITFL